MFEIERKFLSQWSVEQILDYFREQSSCLIEDLMITQLYMGNTGDWAIRFRHYARPFQDYIVNTYILTVKKPINPVRNIEIECEIERGEFEGLVLHEPKNLLVKKRYEIKYVFDAVDWKTAVISPRWFIDIFENPALGNLMLIEVELPTEDYDLELPPFIDREVTDDPQYRNAKLFEKINDIPV